MSPVASGTATKVKIPPKPMRPRPAAKTEGKPDPSYATLHFADGLVVVPCEVCPKSIHARKHFVVGDDGQVRCLCSEQADG